MPASELYLWVAYDKVSPIGDERSDIQAAQISSAIYQSQGAKISLKDTLLQWKQCPKDEIEGAHDFFQSIQKVQKHGG